jgi:type IV pilus assembly protein PilY1
MRIGIERIGSFAMWLLLLAGLCTPGTAAAQDPDMREIFPYVMLVIDTSGSMEQLPACPCKTPGCAECLPICDDVDPEKRKNRWAVTLEALTGEFNNFACKQLPRIATAGATYDAGYFMPYHQPWLCSSGGVDGYCPMTSTEARIDQRTNGILDTYAAQVRFGLMTFDGWDTYKGAPPLIPNMLFDRDRSEGRDGLWSYGGKKPFRYPGCEEEYAIDTGARSEIAEEGSLVSMNSCSGGLRGSATCPDWCTHCPATEVSLNTDIQEALLSARPYGGTPIAASLDDLYTHFRNLDDDFGSCRNRFAVLLTDGRPDADYRDLNCGCGETGTAEDRCLPPSQTLLPGEEVPEKFKWQNMRCPCPRPEDAARNLVHGRSDPATMTNEPAMIERLFVIGLSVDDTDVLDRLNDIGEAGCTDDDCVTDEDTGNVALFADNLTTLVSNLSDVLDGFTKPISRSVPVFGRGRTSASGKQFQISAGFEVPQEQDAPWTGVLERVRYDCSLTGDFLEARDIEEQDKFHEKAGAQSVSTRTLLTVAPSDQSGTGWSTVTTGQDPQGHLWSDTSSCGTATDPEGRPMSGCVFKGLRELVPERYGPGLTASQRDDIVDWMLGAANTPRDKKAFGDIYHSSPVLVSAPRYDTADEGFNRFRALPHVATRPQMIYVNTNDGILHALHAENYSPLGGGTQMVAGEEQWGFVPPMLLDRLEENQTMHQILLDATPKVKDVFLSRLDRGNPSSADYRTVLITGMRGGGRGYIALDVTDPIKPKFLWQFTDPDMGLTFGQAAIGQAVYKLNPNDTASREGAVAILPGGVGERGTETGECLNNENHVAMMNRLTNGEFTSLLPIVGTTNIEERRHRRDIRCWKKTGRAIYFVEVASGKLLKKLYAGADGKRIFPSPIVSAPAVYPADTGSLMTEAFVTDADGVIWRIDMRAPNQLPSDEPLDGWTARPFHDIFYDRSPKGGELTYDAPILSVNDNDQVVVIVGTGDTNNFADRYAHNRVVSLTETIDISGGVGLEAPERYKASVNWEMRYGDDNGTPHLVESELVTGAMALFNSTLYFATFIAVAPGSDVCDLGKGRIHAVHYLNPSQVRNQDEQPVADDTALSQPVTNAPLLVGDLEAIAAGTTGTGLLNVHPDRAQENLMLMGLALTQRPSCKSTQADTSVWGDVYQNIVEPNEDSLFLVAQASGDSSLLNVNDGGKLRDVELGLNRPDTFARIVSWAGGVE